MTYAALEDKIGKRNLKKATELYRKYVMEQMGRPRKHVMEGVTQYLVEIVTLLKAKVNIEKIVAEVTEDGFYDQVVLLGRIVR
jgi:hypothetical protein